MRDAGHRTAEKAKIIYPPPRGVDIIIHFVIRLFSKGYLDMPKVPMRSLD